jgi:FkbM family methyltransferase
MQNIFGTESSITIFDVGAHVGQTSRLFRKIFPNAKIFAFEPFPESFKLCKESLKNDIQARVANVALSNINGSQILHANSSSATNSILKTDARAIETWGSDVCTTEKTIEVRTETLDTFLTSENICKIDLLKLDVQGAEYLVLNGARESCRQNKIEAIYAEIITQPTYEQQMRFDKIIAIYYELGFELFDIYFPCHTKSGRLCQVDALFTRASSH